MIPTAGDLEGGAIRRDLFLEVSQRRAKSLFEGRVVDRKFKDIGDGELELNHPGQKMGEVLSSRGADLSAQKPSVSWITVNFKKSLFFTKNDRSPLALKTHLSFHEMLSTLGEFLMRLPHQSDIWFSEDDR